MFKKVFDIELELYLEAHYYNELPAWYSEYKAGNKVSVDRNVEGLMVMIAQTFRLTPDEIDILRKKMFK